MLPTLLPQHIVALQISLFWLLRYRQHLRKCLNPAFPLSVGYHLPNETRIKLIDFAIENPNVFHIRVSWIDEDVMLPTDYS